VSVTWDDAKIRPDTGTESTREHDSIGWRPNAHLRGFCGAPHDRGVVQSFGAVYMRTFAQAQLADEKRPQLSAPLWLTSAMTRAICASGPGKRATVPLAF
jgi:hypothetical protein